jgi:extracellular factor (EF) 3-hydroxypalmitic acid methyl ester biosynthesis protein
MARVEDSGRAHAAGEPLRPRRMRARRLRMSDLELEEVHARFRHRLLGELDGLVEDVSLHGMAVVIAGGARYQDLVTTGDRIDDLAITCVAPSGRGDDGSAVVRRVAERGADLVLGLELDASSIDLGQLHRHGARVDFARRWARARQAAEYPQVQAAFRTWVAELHTVLDSAQRFLDAEDRALATRDLRTAHEARREALAVVGPDLTTRFAASRAQLAALVDGFSEQQHAEHRAYAALHLHRFSRQAPLPRRALDRPLGYAGDYEMMNMLYRDPAEGDTLFGQALNICYTEEPAAVANKNRIAYLGALIRRTVADRPDGRVRIASLGCGPAREIQVLLQESPELGPRLEVALIDQELGAIAHCEQTLAPLAATTGARIHVMHERLRNLLPRNSLLQKLGPCALIYSAGLFDYLQDRAFSRMLSVLFEALLPGGVVAVGNVATHNPSRWVMEYLTEWFLIHRSPLDLLRLASELRGSAASMTVDAEPSGVNLFLLVRR